MSESTQVQALVREIESFRALAHRHLTGASRALERYQRDPPQADAEAELRSFGRTRDAVQRNWLGAVRAVRVFRDRIRALRTPEQGAATEALLTKLDHTLGGIARHLNRAQTTLRVLKKEIDLTRALLQGPEHDSNRHRGAA